MTIFKRCLTGSFLVLATSFMHGHMHAESKAGSDLKLVMVQVVSRHGDRAPLRPLPLNHTADWDCSDVLRVLHIVPPSAGEMYERRYIKDRQRMPGTCHAGQLTSLGVAQMKSVGEWLRHKYVTQLALLSPNYHPHEVYVRSTDIPRTIDSAISLLTGLYPPSTRRQDLPPIPIHIIEDRTETMYFNSKLCPPLQDAIKAYDKSEVYRLRKKDNEPLRAELATAFGLSSAEDLPNNLMLFDSINCHDKHGKPVPVTKEQRDRLQKAAHTDVYDRILSTQTLRLGVGPFVGELLHQIDEKIAGKTPIKFSHYSAHDGTLITLLKALGGWDNRWPEYASHVELETMKDRGGNYSVRVLYNGKEAVLEDCGVSPCPLGQFRAICQQYIPNLETECKPLKAAVSPPKED
mmetsp:Transcript_24513/g.40313  ORF Transcript_24513/g.40313 Transcript_24513/m.40313 type:complete len:405 (+) Transcript_24513:72-1286(+)